MMCSHPSSSATMLRILLLLPASMGTVLIVVPRVVSLLLLVVAAVAGAVVGIGVVVAVVVAAVVVAVVAVVVVGVVGVSVLVGAAGGGVTGHWALSSVAVEDWGSGRGSRHIMHCSGSDMMPIAMIHASS